jgi:hypothetical protein
MTLWKPLRVALCLALLVPGARAAAQLDAQILIMPRAGVLTPADWFFEVFHHFGIDPLEWTQGAIQRSPIAGAAAELVAEQLGLRMRAELLRTIGSETSLTHAVLHTPSGFNPPHVVRTRYVVPSAITMASIDLVLPTRLMLPLGIQPYVSAGAALKHYAFDNSELQPLADLIVLPKDGATAAINIGAGATIRVRGAHLDLLVRDAISHYWNRRQHDVMVVAGLAVRVL